MAYPSFYTPRFLQMVSSSTPIHATLFFLLIFFSMASFKLSYCMRDNAIFCPEIEKQSLLSFKQSSKDPDNLLSSWDGGVNCCKWKHVVCSNMTGHVHQLHLRRRNPQFQGLSGKINPSLLNLKHLRHLDLSQNDFTGQTIPSFIGSFTNLEYLNLSVAGFHGKVPHNIGNLSNLHTLDLSSHPNSQGLGVEVDSLEWLSGLSRLQYLNMNFVNLSKATNWDQVINTLPSLVELRLKSCSLDFMARLDDVNITSVTLLDLSANRFQSLAVPTWIFQLTNLLFLDLSYNYFIGPIPTVSNATKLQYIDLSINYFSSNIPDWLYFLKDLEFVYMNYNLLQNTISNAIANLTSINTLDLSHNELSGKIPREISNLCKIQWLDLSYNKLQGGLSDSFGTASECFFQSLQYLDLGGNSMSGPIPSNLGKLLSLEYLTLFGNKFTGNLPESLGQLFSLQELWIGENMLEGVVTEIHFANLTKLETFSAYGNHLTLKVSPGWNPPIHLTTLELGSWNLETSSQIPSWLKTQKNISALDLSDTGISGSIPSWFWEIQYLNLSHNHLHGEIPYIRGAGKEWTYMYLSSNQFSGSLPRIGDNVIELDLSNNSFFDGVSPFLCDMTNGTYGMRNLHLGGNQLSGELPDCWMKWPSLRYLNLGNNNMFGTIPNSIGFLTNLQSLNLYSNKFSSRIPFSLHNCTRLVKIDVADNDLDGDMPAWMGASLVKLRILILRSNKLSGNIPSEICHLNSLQILDLSDNKFSGVIPRCVYNFTAMATRRSSVEYNGENSDYSYSIYTAFGESVLITTKGTELQYDTILPLVTSIDLSKNNLLGDIPTELTSLAELRSLNLSGNHLTGLIPTNVGDMKQLESLDFSRNSLSGQIPRGFTLMSFLNHLNLSYNNLTGRIPESTQLLTMDASSFIGNNLCGPPLTGNCSHDGDEVHGHKEDDEDEGDESKIEWFYVFLSLGYAVGFSVVCTTLVLKKSWREAYFGLLECIWNKLCVCLFHMYV